MMESDARVPQALRFSTSKVQAFLLSCHPGVRLNSTTEHVMIAGAGMGYVPGSSCPRLEEEAEEAETPGAMGTWGLEARGRSLLLAGGGASVG